MIKSETLSDIKAKRKLFFNPYGVRFYLRPDFVQSRLAAPSSLRLLAAAQLTLDIVSGGFAGENKGEFINISFRWEQNLLFWVMVIFQKVAAYLLIM